jgi:hypothetical protein
MKVEPDYIFKRHESLRSSPAADKTAKGGDE